MRVEKGKTQRVSVLLRSSIGVCNRIAMYVVSIEHQLKQIRVLPVEKVFIHPLLFYSLHFFFSVLP